MIACAVVDFPDPDSPTIATVSPGIMVNPVLRMAWTVPLWVRKVTSRSLTSSSGCWVFIWLAFNAGPSPSGRARLAGLRPS
jgi:hypothetical protein